MHPTTNRSSISAASQRRRTGGQLLLALVYAALIVYGSLYPFSDWSTPAVPLFSFILVWPSPLDKADVIQNLLIYAPLGIFVVTWLGGRMRFLPALLFATLAGSGLSFMMESIQQFLPSRVASMADLAMNAAGTFMGGLLAALLTRETLSGTRLLQLRDGWFRAGHLPNIGLVTIGLWALSQTSPLVPSLDVAHLRHGLSLLRQSLTHPQDINLVQATTYAFYIAGLGLLAGTLGHRGKPVIALFMALVAFMLACKVLVVGRQLSLEAVTGAVAAVLLLVSLRSLTSKLSALAGIMLIAAGFVLYELAPGSGLFTYPFNWIPFFGQMRSLTGLENILEMFWPFMAIAYFTRYLVPVYRRDETALCGSFVVLAALFLMEWHQQALPGRYGDITQALLGFSGWLIPWCIGFEDYISQRPAAAFTQVINRATETG
jgi:VanZ family protein